MTTSSNTTLGVNNRQRLHQSVPPLWVTPDSSTPGSRGTGYGMARSVSTTLSESIRAAASQEAKGWNLSSLPKVLRRCDTFEDPRTISTHVRWWSSGNRRSFARFRNSQASGLELSNTFRRHNLHRRDNSEEVGGPSKRGDELIRECRGTGLDFVSGK
jgi:hypothetical protein